MILVEDFMNYLDLLENDIDEMHRDVREEVLFFRKCAAGDIYAVKQNVEEHRFRDSTGVGTLSKDPLLNLKYHMVITAGIITRVCIEKGLEAEKAFQMSDYYIRKLDYATTEDEVEQIHDDMVLDFTGQMRIALKDKNLSRAVSMALDYIYAHLSERITIKDLANHTGVSASFLSREFSNELGISISDYIRDKKIEMSQELLINSDMSIIEIACQLSFSSQSHFIQVFKTLVGETPKKYRSKNQKKWTTINSSKDSTT